MQNEHDVDVSKVPQGGVVDRQALDRSAKDLWHNSHAPKVEPEGTYGEIFQEDSEKPKRGLPKGVNFSIKETPNPCARVSPGRDSPIPFHLESHLGRGLFRLPIQRTCFGGQFGTSTL